MKSVVRGILKLFLNFNGRKLGLRYFNEASLLIKKGTPDFIGGA